MYRYIQLSSYFQQELEKLFARVHRFALLKYLAKILLFFKEQIITHCINLHIGCTRKRYMQKCYESRPKHIDVALHCFDL